MTIIIWPDGTWCSMGELEEFLTFMGDDYVIHAIDEDIDPDSYASLIARLS